MSARLSDHGYRARRAFGALAALLLVAALAATARAQGAASDWERTAETDLRLIAATAGVGEADALRVGLQFVLKPGWKTYWRSPGEAGFPVSVDWTGSRNLADAQMAWPVPHRFSLFGLETFGYDTQVVFPITVRPERPGEPVRLTAHVNYLLCKEICIPYDSDLVLDLPAGPATPTEYAQLIDRFDAQVPGDGAAHGLDLERVSVAAGGDQPVLEVVARSRFPFAAPDLIVEGPAGLWFSPPAVTVDADGHRATLRVAVGGAADATAVAQAPLTLTLFDGVRGMERSLTAGEGMTAAVPGDTAGGETAATAPLSLWPMLLVALLGGLILNLMPCVLPVLSLKLLGIVGFGGAAAAAVRRSFLASAAGVVSAFIALAAALVGLKSAGVAIGWGIQFQQPVFLVVMALIVTLFACNLWGWFEIPLPRWMGAVGAIGSGRPQEQGHGSLAGAFMTGVLATLLATPCSAPFVGTAVGFALSRGSGEILAIFAALGLGLALPYLVVATVPRLATWLPRPGRWMLWLRRVLGLALAATAVWLLSILAAQLPPAGVAVVAAMLVAAAGLVAVRPRLPREARVATPALVALLAVVAVVASARFEPPAGKEAPALAAGTLRWQAWDPAAIGTLVAQGKRVLVDVTADWCITCQVNKRFVLDSAPVASRLDAEDVVVMRADWTRPDDAIANYLASFGRYGIPFNVVYGPAAPDGIALPELLSESSVLEALDAAATARAAGG